MEPVAPVLTTFRRPPSMSGGGPRRETSCASGESASSVLKKPRPTCVRDRVRRLRVGFSEATGRPADSGSPEALLGWSKPGSSNRAREETDEKPRQRRPDNSTRAGRGGRGQTGTLPVGGGQRGTGEECVRHLLCGHRERHVVYGLARNRRRARATSAMSSVASTLSPTSTSVVGSSSCVVKSTSSSISSVGRPSRTIWVTFRY